MYDELYHRESKQKFKYLDKIKLSNGKWRYIYTEAERRKYSGKVDAAIDKGVDQAKAAVKSVDKKVKDVIDKLSNKQVNNLKFTQARGAVKKATNFIRDELGIKIGKETTTEYTTVYDKPTNNNPKERKYVGKVKTANGEYRYFYSQDDYDEYNERLNYQKNEPEFMKHVRNIDPNDIFTKDENADKVNEAYNPKDPKHSRNCSNCSAAYELRMRGYDVEAKPVTDGYNGRGDRFYDYFENAEVLNIYGDGSTSVIDEKFAHKYSGGTLTGADVKRYKDECDFAKNDQKYTASAIEKAIKDNNPPGSRGMIDVNWNDGGAHSIIYEVDSSGTVTIRDAQTYDVYPVDKLASKVSKVRICRTDNLQVKEGILNAVRTNSDEERKYIRK